MRTPRTKGLLAPAGAIALLAGAAAAAETPEKNLVTNGTFEQWARGAPVGWVKAGNGAVRQELTRAPGRASKSAAKLTCTAYERRSPSSHMRDSSLLGSGATWTTGASGSASSPAMATLSRPIGPAWLSPGR